MIEIPRYVHRAGDSMLVDTLEELQIAESEGWRVNPNEPDELWTDQPEPATVLEATGEAERVSTVAVETALGDAAEERGEALDAPDVASELGPGTDPSEEAALAEGNEPEPAAPVKRWPGRPKKKG